MAKISHVRGPKGAPHVFIATPTYTGKLPDSYVFSLLHTLPKLQEAGMGYDHYVLSYNCHVDDSRNGILRDFLLSDCTDLLFIDADVSWIAGDLVKLLSYDEDFVAGVYPRRQKNEPFPVLVEPGKEIWADSRGLVEVQGVPTGFLRLRRSVVQKMVDANSHRQFMGMDASSGDAPYTIVFERTYQDGARWSGDYAFCQAWRKMGGKIFVDPTFHLSHQGEIEFSGSLAEHWREKHGLAAQEREQGFDAGIIELRRGEPTPNTWLKLFRGWGNEYAAQPDLLAILYELAKLRTGPILETGSGLTSIVMAIANPSVTVHCLEHSPIWAGKVYDVCAKYGIRNVIFHRRELKDYGGYRWYDTEDLPREHFDMVLCDGPPRKQGTRKGLFLNCSDLINGGLVVMDDADDPAQLRDLREWSEANGRQVKTMGEGRLFALSYKEKK